MLFAVYSVPAVLFILGTKELYSLVPKIVIYSKCSISNYKVNYVNAQVRNAGCRVGETADFVCRVRIYTMARWAGSFPFPSRAQQALAPCSFETLRKCTPGVSADAFNRFKWEILRILQRY